MRKRCIPKDSNRAESMRVMYESGATQQEIGVVYRVSRERVRQIIRDTGCDLRVPFRTDILAVAKALRSAESFAHATRLAGGVDVATMTMHAKHLGMYDALLRLYRLRKHRSGVSQRQRVRSDMLERLRDLALRLGRTPTMHDINRDADTYSHMTYCKHFGSIRESQRLAGLTPNSKGRRPKPFPHGW